jgi:dihydrofolate reductase
MSTPGTDPHPDSDAATTGRPDGAGPPHLAIVAAVARNGAIGRDNGLLWREPADQRHFRETTQGHAVLMGRKTWDSLPPRFRPLPGRRNVVVSRQPGLALPGAEVWPSLPAALAALQGAPRVLVIGGGELYALALPFADELVLTEIDADLDGDTFFPRFDRAQWQEADRRSATQADGTRYAFVSYRRRAASA